MQKLHKNFLLGDFTVRPPRLRNCIVVLNARTLDSLNQWRSNARRAKKQLKGRRLELKYQNQAHFFCSKECLGKALGGDVDEAILKSPRILARVINTDVLLRGKKSVSALIAVLLSPLFWQSITLMVTGPTMMSQI